MDFGPKQIRDAVVFLIALILSITVHEFGHAFSADKLGDGLPRSQGRVTLNPLAHIDPIGTLIIPLVILFTHAPLLGWGKPVQINPVAFTRRLSMRTSDIIVTLAGPVMNVILALLVTIIYTVLLATNVFSGSRSEIQSGIEMVIMLNWSLAFFNLIPIPPLDGGHILCNLLPRRHENIGNFLQQYGFMLLMGLVVTGAVNYLLYPAGWVASQVTTLIVRIAI